MRIISKQLSEGLKKIQSGKKRDQLQVVSKDGVEVKYNVIELR